MSPECLRQSTTHLRKHPNSAIVAEPAADGATQVVPVACGWYGPPVVHVIQNDTSDETNENGNLEITLR